MIRMGILCIQKYRLILKTWKQQFYTKDLHHTPISWDDLNLIETSWPKAQVEDFMNKAKMISAVFLP